MDWTKYRNRLGGFKTTLYMILIAFLASSIMTYIAGAPFSQFYTTLKQAIETPTGLGTLVALTTVFVLTGLAASIPFSASVWNVGGEGQIYMGALAATAVIVALGTQSILVVVAAALVTGGAWGLLPAIMKFKFRTNEIVSTLLLNFVAMYIVIYAVREPLRLPASITPQSEMLPQLFSIPNLLATIVVVVVVAYVLTERTRLGYEIQVVGRNPRVASYAGINIAYTGVLTMVIGGALAGLGGAIIVTSNLMGTLMPGISSNYGYVGIGIALMARLHSTEVPLSAFILALLFVTVRLLSTSVPTIPLLLSTAVVGIIMIAVAIVRRE